MNHNTTRFSTFLTVRVTRELHEDLRRAAEREANTPSAVARRLIKMGLAREQQADGESPKGNAW